MNKLITIISFVTGAVIGSLITYKYIDEKNARMLEEEVDKFKDYAENEVHDIFFTAGDNRDSLQTNSKTSKIHHSKAPIDKPNILEYVETLKELQYVDESDEDDDDYETPYLDPSDSHYDEDAKPPYVINPDDFVYSDYEKISLVYYADDVLTNEDDSIVDNVEFLVGSDSLNHFGEYEEDVVYVRNDRIHKDFEILRDNTTYDEEVIN